MRKRTRGVGTVVGGCAVTLALGLGAQPAAAQEAPRAKPLPEVEAGPTGQVPEGFGSWEDLLRRQERLNTAADRLSEAAGSEPGFTGIVAAPERPYLTLFWHGELPEQVAGLVAELPGQVPVEVVPARHPLAELLTTQEAIAAEPGGTSVTPHIDGSGLTVGYRGSVEEAWRLAAVQAVLSAGHRGSVGDRVVDGGGEAMGTIEEDIDGADPLLIGGDGDVFGINTTFRPWVYADSWHPGFPSRAVAGTASSYVGNYVCTSGAATGEHCGVRVNAVNVTVWGTVTTVRASQWTGHAVVGKSDSGGPVISHRWWAWDRVNAKGIVSAGSRPTACPAGALSPACFATVYFVDIDTALDRFTSVVQEVEIVTG